MGSERESGGVGEWGRISLCLPLSHSPALPLSNSYCFFPENVPSPMPAKLTLPFIVLPSVVPEYVIVPSTWPLTLNENSILSPLTVPVRSASPNAPLYLPVSFSPSCLKVKLGLPEPASVSTVTLHAPVTSILSPPLSPEDCAAAAGAAPEAATAEARLAFQSP